ncbi:hypothetical protein ACQ4PT_011945 [Festuca glaucescens]
MADGGSRREVVVPAGGRREEVLPPGGRREEVVGSRSSQRRKHNRVETSVPVIPENTPAPKNSFLCSCDVLECVSELFAKINGAEEEVVVEANGGAEEVNLGGGEEGVADLGGREEVVERTSREGKNIRVLAATGLVVTSPTGVVSLKPLARNVLVSNKPSFEYACLPVGEDGSEGEDGDDDVVVCARGQSEDADQLKKIAEKELQLITPKPPKYRYSKEEDTELTRADREKMNQEEADFDAYRRDVESSCRVSFEQRTTLSSMHFAHYTPRQIPFGIVTTEATLQIFSFNIVSCELSWPLYVYGVIAVRDHQVDDHRNILFERRRRSAQLVTRDDPSLGLFGPSRAISAVDPAKFEIELKLKGRTESRDILLVKQSAHYSCPYIGFHTIDFSNCLCKAELSLEQLGDSVQATFLSVCVVEGGPCTFMHGGRVYCSALAHEATVMDSTGNVEIVDPPSSQFVLIDSRDCAGGKLPMYDTGLLDLARCVVSVPIDKCNDYSPEYEESLKVVIQAYSPSGDVADHAHVKLRPKLSNTSRVECVLGNSKVEIIIAWSVMLKSNYYLI